MRRGRTETLLNICVLVSLQGQLQVLVGQLTQGELRGLFLVLLQYWVRHLDAVVRGEPLLVEAAEFVCLEHFFLLGQLVFLLALLVLSNL